MEAPQQQANATAFQQSTQNKFWMFKNEKEINDLRKNVFQNSLLRYKMEVLPNPLTFEEQMLLIHYYQQKLFDVCAIFNLPDKVAATSMAYLKRFYLYESVVDHLPELIMLTSVYLACKVEEHRVDASEIGKRVDRDAAIITTNEVQLLKGLRFHLNLYHPFRPLHGFLLQLQSKISPITIQNLHTKANKLISQSILCTDAAFLYKPPLIALAMLRVASGTELCKEIVENFIQELAVKSPSKDEFLSKLQHIEGLVKSQITIPDENKVKEIEYKISLLRKSAH